MSQVAFRYDHIGQIFIASTVQWLDDDIFAALIESSYVPDYSIHTQYSDVSGHEVTGGNYPAGGIALSGKIVAGGRADAANPTFTNLTATYRYVAFYGGATRHGLTKPLIALYLPDDTPADTIVVASNHTIQLSGNGFITYKPA